MSKNSTESPGNLAGKPEDYPAKGVMIRHDLLSMIDHPVKRVLSVGCGTGHSEEILSQEGAEVWGIEIVPEAIKEAEQRLHRVVTGDLETHAFEEIPVNYFDLVLCGDVLEHMRYPERVLDLIKRWMAPDGQFVASVPSSCHYQALRQLAFHRDWPYAAGGIFDYTHYRNFTPKSFTRLLERRGFEIKQRRRKLAIGRMRHVSLLIKTVCRLLPPVEDYFIAECVVSARVSPNDRAV